MHLIPLITYAAQVTLGWIPSESSVTGYKMYYGTTSGDYDYSVNVGNYTNCTISGLQEGAPYYFAVTAYNEIAESDYSGEVEYTIPITAQQSDPQIYVSDISIDFSKKGPNYYARAYIIIWDEIDRAVSGVVVSGQWFLNGKYINEVSDSSDRKGVANLIVKKVKAQSGDQLTLMITDVVKYGYKYDFGSDIADEISINFP